MAKNTLTVTREIRGGTAHCVHVMGPIDPDNPTFDAGAPSAANAEARKWAKELGKSRAYQVSSGGDYNVTEQGKFRHSVCYGFED